MKLIVGLGNPGPEYAAHKHNVGYRIVEEIARRFSIEWNKDEATAWVAEGKAEEEAFILAKPQSWMNVSGRPTAALLRRYGLQAKDLVVAHDDLDLEEGKIRWGFGSGAGGHNGIRSVIDQVGTPDFFRLRFGIGRPPPGSDPADYVLSPFGRGLKGMVEERIALAAESAEAFLKKGLEWVQNRYNK